MRNLSYKNLLYRRKQRLTGFLLLLAFLNPLNSEDDFFDEGSDISENGKNGFDEEAKPEFNLQFNGFASIGVRYWLHKNIKKVEAYPKFGLDLKHESPKTELEAKLKVNANTLAEYPLDVLNEFTLRAFLGDFVLSAGKMKIVWGKGDMLHVLDVFNANDFTDFTIPNYIDRRIAEPMLHLAYNAPIPLNIELAWTPMMTPDRIALSGQWVPPQIEAMKKMAIGQLGGGPRFPTEKVEALIKSSISNTLKKIVGSPSETVDIQFPNLTDAEIDEILSKFSFLEKPVAKAVLLGLSGKKISVDTTGILTNEKINEIATKESKKYTTLLQAKFTEKISTAINKIQQFSLDPFIKMGMNAFLPDIHNIKYGQYGIRLTGSVKSVDMGVQYYFGHYKTPSIDYEKMIALSLTNSLNDFKACVHYDPVHIFGIDLGVAIAMFNIKTEFAYYMTYDFKGNNSAVHNNSLQWVAGFDVNIPLNNLNLNIQNLGSWILGFKKVKKNTELGKIDMNWNTAEKSTNNKLIINISDSWLNGSLTDSFTLIWGIEHNDIVIMPTLKYKIKDELYIEGRGAYIYAKNKKSEFSSWQNNHFAQLSMEYKF